MALTRIWVVAALFALLPLLATASTPVATYGTYFGGTGGATGVAVAVDPSGNVVVAGSTSSQTLPGTANALQPTKAAGFPYNSNLFIAKFDPTGRTLLWATFLGGDGNDTPTALAVDTAGNIYVTGTTTSSNFPAQGYVSCTAGAKAPAATCAIATTAQSSSSFVAKISPNGSTLLYSLYLVNMAPEGIAVDGVGEAHVLETQGGGPEGIYLLSLNPGGTALVYATFLGGNGFNGSRAYSLVLDPLGNAYVVGSTAVPSIPTTANAFQSAYSNASLTNSIGPGAVDNGFILEINSSGSQILYGTYFGPEYFGTRITGVELDGQGSLYIIGTTNATSFQSTASAYQSAPGVGFVAKLTPGASALSEFSYLPNAPTSLILAGSANAAYLLFDSALMELNLSTLGLASPTSTFTLPNQGDTVLSGVALSATVSWLIGSCDSGGITVPPPCPLGNLISANAFQTTPQNPGSWAVLIQVTDETLTINSVVNAASFLSGPASPGEIVTITGADIGPTTPATLTLDQTGKVATSLGGVQVLFSGTAAPLTYVSASQINCVVPYEIQGLLSPYVQVSYSGQPSPIFPLVPAATAPALFTANGSGSGPVAALNQNNTYNSPSNPAAKGSYVTFYLTGEGQTSPNGVTGKVTTVSPTPPLTPQPLLAVAVLINGQPATVAFYGEAPGLVSGVMQLDVQIPANAPSGNLPLQVSVGGNSSQSGVTISVQ
jgi:uncharacterized protein (TIGR03437 family)